MWPGREAGILVAVGALGMCTYLTGCLLPPPVEEVAKPDNQPPRIDPESLIPGPTQGPWAMSPNCPTTFKATLFDPDGDVIYWRVFLDYFNGGDREPEVRQAQPDATGRPRAIDFTPDPSSFTDVELHTLELFVADRDFTLGPTDNEGRVLSDDTGLSDSFAWSVQLDEELPCQ